MKARLLIVAAIGLFVLCNVAQAELKPANHTGLYLGFGVGGGTAGFNPNNSSVEYDREGGVSVNLRIGGSIQNDLLIGLEMDAWRKEEHGAALQYNNYAATLIYYPHEMLFIKGGPALSVVVAEVFGFMDTDSGVGFTVGGGAELRLGTKFALVPSFQYAYQNLDDYSTNFFSFLMGCSWFW
jgi:hypothetical protein